MSQAEYDFSTSYWRTYPKDPRYEVHCDGRVRRASTKRIRKPTTKNGYFVLTLSMPRSEKKSMMRYVNMIVAETWLGECPPEHEVRHKDGNRQNNHAGNLRYSKWKVCNRRRVIQRPMNGGEKNSNSKLTTVEVRAIRDALAVFVREQAKRLSVSESAVQRVVEGESWKDEQRTTVPPTVDLHGHSSDDSLAASQLYEGD